MISDGLRSVKLKQHNREKCVKRIYRYKEYVHSDQHSVFGLILNKVEFTHTIRQQIGRHQRRIQKLRTTKYQQNNLQSERETLLLLSSLSSSFSEIFHSTAIKCLLHKYRANLHFLLLFVDGAPFFLGHIADDFTVVWNDKSHREDCLSIRFVPTRKAPPCVNGL